MKLLGELKRLSSLDYFGRHKHFGDNEAGFSGAVSLNKSNDVWSLQFDFDISYSPFYKRLYWAINAMIGKIKFGAILVYQWREE